MLEVTDGEGEIQLLTGFKYIVILEDTISSILTTTHSTSLVFCETRVPIQYRGGHTPQFLTIQDRLRYLNLFYIEILMVLISPQNMVKMFPHITGVESIALSKSNIGISKNQHQGWSI